MHVALLQVIRSVEHLLLDFFEVDLASPSDGLGQERGVKVVLLKLHAEDLALLIDAAEVLELSHFLRV